MNWVWANSPTSGNERLVLLALADACSRDDGTGCWPSAATIARKANVSDRTVRRVIARLEADGQVIVHRGGGRTGSTNAYTVVTGIHSPGQTATPDKVPGDDSSDRPPLTQLCQGTPDTAMSPDPPTNHQRTATTHARKARDGEPPAGEVAAEVEAFFDQLAALSPQWLLTRAQRSRLTPAVADAIGAGWAPGALAEFTGANTAGIRNPGVARATSARGCWTTTATRRTHAYAARPASHTLSRTAHHHSPQATSVPDQAERVVQERR